ncbi:hypothetical protein HDV62DRAFT_374137 [Trichoderma sp. SZMC 28011]
MPLPAWNNDRTCFWKIPTNVPRMWPPLLCIASWITACMNTYMHSCEATLSTWYCINEGLWAEEQYGVASTRVHPR